MSKHSPAFLKLVTEARKNIKECTVNDLKSLIDSAENFILLDVREDHEWSAGHIPGAQHLGRGIIERDIEIRVPDRHAELILYCGGGYRSALAAESLKKMGYKRVISVDGGFRAWQEAGYKIIKPC